MKLTVSEKKLIQLYRFIHRQKRTNENRGIKSRHFCDVEEREGTFSGRMFTAGRDIVLITNIIK